MTTLIDSLTHGVPGALTELITLGRTLKKRAADVLAYFDRPGTSNGPTEAINGRLEHLRGSALGFPQPHQLHRQIPARNRRLQTSTTRSIAMSLITGGSPALQASWVPCSLVDTHSPPPRERALTDTRKARSAQPL